HTQVAAVVSLTGSSEWMLAVIANLHFGISHQIKLQCHVEHFVPRYGLNYAFGVFVPFKMQGQSVHGTIPSCMVEKFVTHTRSRRRPEQSHQPLRIFLQLKHLVVRSLLCRL